MNKLEYKGNTYGYNFTCKYNKLPNQVKDMIINCKNRYNDSCFHNPVVYFTIERDYFVKISCMYYDKDNEYLNFIDLPVNVNIATKDITCDYAFDLYDDRQQQKDSKAVVEWFKGQLKDKFYITKDYDTEQINEALELGDYELVEDIVGDRDLFEFI